MWVVKSQSATAKKILFLFLIPPKVGRSGESELCEQNEEQKQRSNAKTAALKCSTTVK